MDNDPLNDIFATARAGQARSAQALEDLATQLPTLRRAIDMRTGQGAKIARIVRSVWNGENTVGLCDDLSGLDYDLAEGVIALIAARLFCGGDADDLIRPLL